MKNFIFFSLFIISLSVKAQLSVELGNDTALCSQDYISSSLRLGEHLEISGGSGNYTYAWSAKYSYSETLFFTASDFLDDTTSANPALIEALNDSLTFKLKVYDIDNDITAYDSIKVRFSSFIHLLASTPQFIAAGETVSLSSGFFGGIPPLTYSWTPDYNITDPTSPNTTATPERNTKYTLTVTDSIGCSAQSITQVYVLTVGLNERYKTEEAFSIYPNPINENSVIISNNPETELYITINDASGKIVEKGTMHSGSYPIGHIKTSGIYFFRIENKSEIIKNGKFIVK